MTDVVTNLSAETIFGYILSKKHAKFSLTVFLFKSSSVQLKASSF